MARAGSSDQARLVDQIFGWITRQDLDSLRGVLHEDVELELPFQLAGHPAGARGREAVVSFLTSIRLFNGFTFETTSHALLADNAGIVVRYRSDALVRSTARPYRNSYIGLFEFEGALLRRWTEFHNPLVFSEAFGLDPRTAPPARVDRGS